MRAVVRVPGLPKPFLGGRLWRGGVRVLPLAGCPPPPPLWFFRGGGLCGVGRWLSRSWVLWSLYPVPSLPGCVVCCLCFFFFPAWGVSKCFGCPFSRWAAALSPGAPLGGPVFGAVWVGVWPPLVVLVGGVVAVGRSRAPPPLPPLLVVFFWGGVCLFLPLPSLDWRTHWSALYVVFWFAVGGCVLPGCARAPWVGWVMYTLGLVPLPAGLGSGSAGWVVVPGGFMWPWVSRVPSFPRCRFLLSGGGLCGWTATVVAGRAVALCRCVAGWCGSFRGFQWLDLVRPSVSVPGLVLWCVVVRHAVSCCVLTCCVVLVCAVLRCALLGRTLLRRFTPWCVALCRVASRRAVACCALGCLVVLRCTVVHCGAVCRAASRCAVVGRWRLVWLVSWCGVQVESWLVGGWGVRSGVGSSLGSCCGGLGVPLGPVGRVGVRGVALPGGLCRGPVSSWGPSPWPWALWPCLHPLPVPVRWPLWWPGLSPGGEGLVAGCAAAFPVASSMGVARSPRAGVPSVPCLVSAGWRACAGVFRMASDSRFGGVCWGRASPGVVRRPQGVGGAGPSVVVCPSCVWVLVPAATSSFPAPRSLFPPLPGPWVVSCSHVVSLPVPCPYGRLPVTLGASVPPCQSVPLCPLPSPCPCPFPSRCGARGVGGGGRRWPRPGGGWPGAIGGGFGGCRGGGGPGPRPGGGPPMPPAA